MSRARRDRTENGSLSSAAVARLVLAALFLLSLGAVAMSQPGGPEIVSFDTESPDPQPATNLTTAGGTITTMLLNATTQNPHWKAFVGNITGQLVLNDANNYTIYEWALSSIQGEVYASRNSSITWTSIDCANQTHVQSEEALMNFTSSQDDSITNTFGLSNHDAFWTGSVEFTANECNYVTATYVNDTSQTAAFQEIALHDNESMVYATLIEPAAYGFDFNTYDFQVLVPEKGWEGPTTSSPYYFWAELN